MQGCALDILFVVPAFKPIMEEESIGTLILAKKAKLHGFSVEISRYWDVTADPKKDYLAFRDEYVKHILSLKPAIVSFYCRCGEYHICLDLSAEIKQFDSDVIVLFGGPQAELAAKDTLLSFSSVDFICCGEGENTIVPLLTELLSSSVKDSRLSIPGLAYRTDDGSVAQNKFPELLSDNYIRDYYYYDLIPERVLNNCKSMQIDVGRGCPFSCSYCSTKTFWKRKFRLRNIHDTIDEMVYVRDHYGVKYFDFMHDLFTLDKKRVVQFCEEIHNRFLDVEWSCDSRIDTIDENLIDIMVKSGLKHIFFGIETASPIMQTRINKNLNVSKCDSIIRYCIGRGVRVSTSFMYGFPEETDSDVDLTINMAFRYQYYGCSVFIHACRVMIGTELYNEHSNSLLLSPDIYYDQRVPGFHELYELISSHRQLFSHFCDLHYPLRQELRFLDTFRRILLEWSSVEFTRSCFNAEVVSLKLYRMFCEANMNLLTEKETGLCNHDPEVLKTIMENLFERINQELKR